jgi:signal transduction histidine kinase
MTEQLFPPHSPVFTPHSPVFTSHSQDGSAMEHVPDAAALAAELERMRRRNSELERTISDLSASVRELEAFSQEISHDLKTPLAGIRGYTELLTHLDLGYPRPAEFDEFVAEIGNGTERMRSLIDDVLAMATARGGHLRLAELDLTELVGEVVDEHTGETRPHPDGPAPRITVDPLPAVLGDRMMVRRVLDNLLANAVKYARPGEPAQVHIRARRDEGEWCRIEVTDRGIGVPDGQHEAIFAELHRAHADAGVAGTGLGLTICRRIVQRHGGTIGAEPGRHDGARIWFTLPAADVISAVPAGLAGSQTPA